MGDPEEGLDLGWGTGKRLRRCDTRTENQILEESAWRCVWGRQKQHQGLLEKDRAGRFQQPPGQGGWKVGTVEGGAVEGGAPGGGAVGIAHFSWGLLGGPLGTTGVLNRGG